MSASYILFEVVWISITQQDKGPPNYSPFYGLDGKDMLEQLPLPASAIMSGWSYVGHHQVHDCPSWHVPCSIVGTLNHQEVIQ